MREMLNAHERMTQCCMMCVREREVYGGEEREKEKMREQETTQLQRI